MFRKTNNKYLLIIFAILALLAGSVYYCDRQKGERTFRSELFTVDSSAVTSITIYPKGKGTEFLKLSKAGKRWEILKGNQKHPADSAVVRNILQALARLTPERVAGTDRTSWNTFEISDSASTRVVVEQGQDVHADFRVGKVSFSQDRSAQNYGGNPNFSVKSHIRVAGDDRVYVVDGFLSVMFPDDPGQYRNRTILKFDKSQAAKLTFIYPGDSSFVLSRTGTRWFINNRPADSTATEKYLGSIAAVTGSEFADDAALFPVFGYTLKIEGNSMSPVEISGAMDPGSKKYYVKSASNPSSVFGSSTPDLFNKLFAGPGQFTGQPSAPAKKVSR